MAETSTDRKFAHRIHRVAKDLEFLAWQVHIGNFHWDRAYGEVCAAMLAELNAGRIEGGRHTPPVDPLAKLQW
jgi:hypothetical protein